MFAGIILSPIGAHAAAIGPQAAIPVQIVAGSVSIGSVISKPTVGTGTFGAATVGVSNAAIGSGVPTVFLDLINNSQTATICINFGGTATISGSMCAAGELTLPPLYHRSWEGTFVPTDTISAIASAASTPMTFVVK
jgi:hypothetical protein